MTPSCARSVSLHAGLLAFLVLAAPAAYSQVLYGSLTGNVTDPSGAAVPNAKVDVLNVGTGVEKSASTDERGTYRFSDLQPGTYKVTISAPSFASRVQETSSLT